ncbi:hypothetical protein ACE3MZ_11835 [Paenibacillus sp. WLX1005]
MLISIIALVFICALLSAIVWIGAYGCMKMSNEEPVIRSIRCADDWFE